MRTKIDVRRAIKERFGTVSAFAEKNAAKKHRKQNEPPLFVG